MLSLCLETIRGSFLTENSGILKDFGLDISGISMKIPILSQKSKSLPLYAYGRGLKKSSFLKRPRF
jgi:hypothetical protein